MTTGPREHLQATLADRYVIERELGRGGMATVYLAEDLKHQRPVALKVLHPELAQAIGPERFLREIRIAARLNHPHILSLYDSGEAVPAGNRAPDERLLYYVMPYVDGRSLRDRLTREKQLPVDDAVRIAREVADALAHAHACGVVHRDIKPENILFGSGGAVVSDFGIARAVGQAGGGRLTGAGLALGTPTYMSPEQASGAAELDGRSDVYSLGCVLYEMLAGEPPYTGATPQAILARKAIQPMPSLRIVRETVPPAVEAAVAKALAKVPADRFATAAELGDALGRALTLDRTPLDRTPAVAPRLVRQRRKVALAALLAVGLAGAGWWASRAAAGRGAPRVGTLAVLPFANVGGDSAQAYIADGVGDELATALGKLPGFEIVSRAVSYRYREQRDVDAREVGRKLGARYVVHGTVRRAGGRLRVSAQLMSAASGNEVWSENYVRDSNDVFALPAEITRDIAARFRVGPAADRLPPGAAAATGGTSDREAYDLYLRGRFLLQRRGPGVRQAVEKFEQAIARDSTYARAHAGLSLALELLPSFERIHPLSVGERAIRAARRALALDSTLSEPHTALGLAYQHLYDWGRAGGEHRRAVALGQNDADARIQYGRYLFYSGHVLEAGEQFERARALDPYSAVASAWVAHVLTVTGSNAKALVEAKRALDIDSTSPPALVWAINAHMVAGQRAEAGALAERLRRAVPSWAVVTAPYYATLGDRETVRGIVRGLEAERLGGAPVGALIAYGYLGLGDTARVLDALEQATEARESWPSFISLSEPEYAPLRRSPRFAALVRRVGLDERIFTSPTGGRPR